MKTPEHNADSPPDLLAKHAWLRHDFGNSKPIKSEIDSYDYRRHLREHTEGWAPSPAFKTLDRDIRGLESAVYLLLSMQSWEDRHNQAWEAGWRKQHPETKRLESIDTQQERIRADMIRERKNRREEWDSIGDGHLYEEWKKDLHNYRSACKEMLGITLNAMEYMAAHTEQNASFIKNQSIRNNLKSYREYFDNHGALASDISNRMLNLAQLKSAVRDVANHIDVHDDTLPPPLNFPREEIRAICRDELIPTICDMIDSIRHRMERIAYHPERFTELVGTATNNVTVFSRVDQVTAGAALQGQEAKVIGLQEWKAQRR